MLQVEGHSLMQSIMMLLMQLLLPVVLLIYLWIPCLVSSQLIEAERRKEYKKRGYTWPMKELVPNTEGWRRLMERRFDQVEHIPDVNERYQGWLVTVISAYLQTNFTTTGW